MKIFGNTRAAIQTIVGKGLVAAALACSTGAASACEFRAGSTTGSVAFGLLDPVTAPNVAAAIQFEVRCSPPADYAIAQWTWISANGGASTGRMVGGTPPDPAGIAYSVGISIAGGGANRTLTVTLQIAGPNYANVTAGSYSDILTLSVTP